MQPDSTRDSRSDLTLVALCNQGDVTAFEALYRRYRDWVLGLATRFTGEPNDALDVLQETFTYLLRKFPGLVLTASMTTFLYPVVKNTAIRIRRKRRREGPDEGALAAIPGHDSPPDETAGELRLVLAGLPEAHREVILMRYVDDMSLDEISAALAIPLGTVKSRLHHALNGIRNSPSARKYFAD